MVRYATVVTSLQPEPGSLRLGLQCSSTSGVLALVDAGYRSETSLELRVYESLGLGVRTGRNARSVRTEYHVPAVMEEA